MAILSIAVNVDYNNDSRPKALGTRVTEQSLGNSLPPPLWHLWLHLIELGLLHAASSRFDAALLPSLFALATMQL
jgi:hypothetical protein